MVLNARMQEKYGEDFDITLPDEHHIRCNKFGVTFNTEGAMERGIIRLFWWLVKHPWFTAIERRLSKKDAAAARKASANETIGGGDEGDEEEIEDEEDDMDDVDVEPEDVGPEAFLNSRMSLGMSRFISKNDHLLCDV